MGFPGLNNVGNIGENCKSITDIRKSDVKIAEIIIVKKAFLSILK